MPHAPPGVPPRLTHTERDLLERVPLENRPTALRRMLAALEPHEAQALLAALRQRSDAHTWMQGLREAL